ncbi:hypothetical protein F5Y04DRAFT_242709 [Hypomontagnella monticulosa]|nr:hypothetical protein F5Y04DRAFT_242709 [Hypomontagnella monticulosa]
MDNYITHKRREHPEENQPVSLTGPAALKRGEYACGGTLKSGAKWGCGLHFDRAEDVGLHFQSKEGRICIQPLLDEQRVERRRLWEEDLDPVRVEHKGRIFFVDNTGNQDERENAQSIEQEEAPPSGGYLPTEKPLPPLSHGRKRAAVRPNVFRGMAPSIRGRKKGADTSEIDPLGGANSNETHRPWMSIKMEDPLKAMTYDTSFTVAPTSSLQSDHDALASEPRALFPPPYEHPPPFSQLPEPFLSSTHDHLDGPDPSLIDPPPQWLSEPWSSTNLYVPEYPLREPPAGLRSTPAIPDWFMESYPVSRNQNDLGSDLSRTGPQTLLGSSPALFSAWPGIQSPYNETVYDSQDADAVEAPDIIPCQELEGDFTSSPQTDITDEASNEESTTRGFWTEPSWDVFGENVLRSETALNISNDVNSSNSLGGKLAEGSQDQAKAAFHHRVRFILPEDFRPSPKPELHSSEEFESDAHNHNVSPHVNSEFGSSGLSQRQSFKDDVPFTDSGYASAPNRNRQPASNKIDRPTATNTENCTDSSSRDQDDSRTRYSEATTTRPEIVQKSVHDVCSNIYNRLRRNINNKNWRLIQKSLPYLIKVFAIKLGSNSSDKLELGAMYFIHKHHREIATQLKRLFHPEEEDEPETHKDSSDEMSLFDKMTMWGRHSDEDDTEVNPDDLFQGIEDDNEDADLSTYDRMVVNSAAYEWLISSLMRESLFHWDDSSPNVMIDQIRQKILERLPTGTISKTKTPRRYEVSFRLPWLPLKTRLEKGTQHELITSKQSVVGSFAVAVCSSTDKLQLTTVKEYIDQTWPSSGKGLLSVVEKAVNGAQEVSFSNILADKTNVEAIIRNSHLEIFVTGPTYSIAECGEQLAWLAAALLPTDPQVPVYVIPSLKYVTELASGKSFSHQWIIETSKESTGEISDPATRSKLNWLDKLGNPAIVRGFPITLRPENCPGTEISPKAFGIMGTLGLKVGDRRTLLRLAKRTFELCYQTKGCAVWHILESSCETCSCRHILPWEEDDSSHTPIDRVKFWKNRHILGDCASTLLSFSGPEPPVQPCSDEETSEVPPDSEEISSSRNSSHRDASPEISANSLDSDMLSISNLSEDLFPGFLDSESSIFPIVDTVSSRLVSEYQNSSYGTYSLEVATRELSLEERGFGRNNVGILSVGTQQAALIPGIRSHQTQCDGSGNGTQSNLAHSLPGGTAPSASPARPSKKRSGGDDPEDESEDENSMRKPKSKRPKQNNSRDQRLFACPFWKQDPSKHRDCFPKKLDMISRVKQHLARKHTPTFYCERCFTQFAEEASHQAHMREETGRCRWDPSARLDGISHQQHRELSRKSKTELSEAEKWFAIWDIVFPGRPKPTSPYMDPGLSEDFCNFREFSQSRGPAILAEELQSRGLFMPQDGTESALQVAIARGFNTLFEEWLSNQDASPQPPAPSGSSPVASGRRKPHRQTKTEATTSSSADSGVELGSQALSHNSRQEMSFLPPAQLRPMVEPDDSPDIGQYGMQYPNITSAESQFQHMNNDFPQTFDESDFRYVSQEGGFNFDIGPFDRNLNEIQSSDDLTLEFFKDVQQINEPGYQ